MIKRIAVDDHALYLVKVDNDAVAAEVPSHFLCGRVLEMRRFVENAAVVSPAFAALIDENIINLNYSCTSETASANGCVLSDINITDNLHSYKPPFCERHRWGYEKVLSRID